MLREPGPNAYNRVSSTKGIHWSGGSVSDISISRKRKEKKRKAEKTSTIFLIGLQYMFGIIALHQ